MFETSSKLVPFLFRIYNQSIHLKVITFCNLIFLTYVVLFASGGNPVPKRPEKKIKLVPNSSMV